MNPSEMLRIVDSVHRDKSIDKELVFQAIETALVTAAKKHYGELADVQIRIDRETGVMSGTHDQAGHHSENPRGGAGPIAGGIWGAGGDAD